LLFKVLFGNDAKAARALGVSTMQVWRWRHDRSPLPAPVAEILAELVQGKVMEVHEAQNQLRYFLALPPRPPPPLSGSCAGLHRRVRL
jgi:DNA-binding transcriptional regulator YdaS (Cro superfamily)